MKKTKINNKVVITIILVVIILSIGFFSINKDPNEHNLNKNYDFELVITNKKADLYVLENNTFNKAGEVDIDTFLKLNPDKSNHEEGYLKIDNFKKEYYIYYQDVKATTKEKIYDQRYKRYIPFNKSIITNETFSLYDSNSNLKYKLNYSDTFEIIINQKNNYGVIFENQLLYLKDKDIFKIIDLTNTSLTNTKGIAVLNYHAVYDPDTKKCDTNICHTKAQFQSHLEYIKNNNIFTPTLKELEMYLDGYIQLPKSVVITLDDGWLNQLAVELLNEYKLNGTIFLITSSYDPKKFESKYVEIHSHTHEMHNQGDCPGGQGGGIKCLSEEYIQEDLKKSREILNNTTYFCYPFYEYNEYSISQLKKAGFTMAFAGNNINGQLKAKPGIDKFQIPRYIIYKNTTVNEIKNYIG